MAEMLAYLYWTVKVDANDSEFVLAPARIGQEEEGIESIHSQVLGQHVMWGLDFDCCRDMPLTEECVRQAVAAFYGNDPYFPRPGRGDEGDKRLWMVFKERFLEVSGNVLQEGDRYLVEM